MPNQAPTTRSDMTSNDGPANTASASRFTRMAEAAGVSPAKYAAANVHAEGEVGILARMYLVYNSGGVHGGGESDMSHGGDKRSLSDRLYQIG